MNNSSDKKVLIVGLDTFAKKNILQVEQLNKENYSFDVLTFDIRKQSQEILNAFPKNRLFIVKDNYLKRIFQLVRILSSNHYNHVELYVASRMAFIYFLILKSFSQKIYVIERGDILVFHEFKGFIKFGMKFCYRFADRVIYKEPYMKGILDILGVQNTSFLPNPAPDYPKTANKSKDIDFLWVNRFVVQRRSDWVINCLNQPDFKNAKLVMAGLEEKPSNQIKEIQDYVQEKKSDKTECLFYTDPQSLYQRARFFVLPATIVFGNNSLLESMSQGVVPIVSETEATSFIVQNDKTGLVFKHTEEDLCRVFKRAYQMSEDEYQVLSKNAKNFVEENFSLKSYTKKFVEIYQLN